MIVVGAKGFAKEVLEVLSQLNILDNLAFYDDVNLNSEDFLYNRFPILKNEEQVKDFFKKFGNNFTIGIGNPVLRQKLFEKFTNLGGIFTSVISESSQIGNYDVVIGVGTNILPSVTISNSVKIGMGCILYYNVIVTHDCKIGDFVELSPAATLLGRVEVGNFSHIGSNVTILPNIKIGKNVIIGAGSVVSKNIPDNCVAVGIPAKIIKQD